jgi:hypothetical protein
MNLKLDGAHHWFSAGCFAATLGMIAAGQTALQGVLESGTSVVAVVYWGLCTAFGLASVLFAYMGVMQARHQLELLERRIESKQHPTSGARFSPIKKSDKVDA